MVVPKVIICPICKKRTYVRIQDGGYLNEYPVRINCINCHALITGTYDMSQPNPKGLIMLNAEIEECDVDSTALRINNAEYITEVSGELPCAMASVFDGNIPKNTPFLRTAGQIQMVDRIERLTHFSNAMREWRTWRSIAFQLLDEGSVEHLPKALKNMMGNYSYNCDNKLKSLHCLQENARDNGAYLFYPKDEDSVIVELLSVLETIDKQALHQFIMDLGGADVLLASYRKSMSVFSSFMNIYPNVLPAETYMQYKKTDNSLGIATCSFEDIKTFYQDSYEALLSIIYIPVCIDNILVRKNYMCFDNRITTFINDPGFRNPKGTDYEKYVGLENGKKADLINCTEPIQDILHMTVNRLLRNGIGHNNYQYDGITQQITVFDNRNRNRIRIQMSLMDVALDCLGLAKSSILLGEIILFALRQEWSSEGLQSALHPRFYKGIGLNDRCPCGSGLKFKKCCKAELISMKLTNNN